MRSSASGPTRYRLPHALPPRPTASARLPSALQTALPFIPAKAWVDGHFAGIAEAARALGAPQLKKVLGDPSLQSSIASARAEIRESGFNVKTTRALVRTFHRLTEIVPRERKTGVANLHLYVDPGVEEQASASLAVKRALSFLVTPEASGVTRAWSVRELLAMRRIILRPPGKFMAWVHLDRPGELELGWPMRRLERLFGPRPHGSLTLAYLASCLIHEARHDGLRRLHGDKTGIVHQPERWLPSRLRSRLTEDRTAYAHLAEADTLLVDHSIHLEVLRAGFVPPKHLEAYQSDLRQTLGEVDELLGNLETDAGRSHFKRKGIQRIGELRLLHAERRVALELVCSSASTR